LSIWFQWRILRCSTFTAAVPLKRRKWLLLCMKKTEKNTKIFFFRVLLLCVKYSLYLWWKATTVAFSLLTVWLQVFGCACVRVCMTHRVLHRVYLRVSKAKIIRANLLVVCVISKKERKNTAANNTASVAARLPLYPLGMTQRWKIFISCKPLLVLRKQVVWVVHRIWVIACRRFEGMYRLYLQGCDWLPWSRRCTLSNNVIETSNDCSFIVKNMFLCYLSSSLSCFVDAWWIFYERMKRWKF